MERVESHKGSFHLPTLHQDTVCFNDRYLRIDHCGGAPGVVWYSVTLAKAILRRVLGR